MPLPRRFARSGPFGLLAAAALLAGCTTPVVVAGTAVDAVSLTSTKKLLVDHAASAVTGMDCSFIGFNETGHYCVEPMVVDRSNLYCYRTLADVDCHHIPDPYRNGQAALASPPPVLKPVGERGIFD